LKDCYGRNIEYLRISVTDRCNLRCTYCAAAEIFRYIRHEDIIRFEEIERVVRVATALGIDKFRITGGEPLLRKNLAWLVESLSSIPGVADLSLTTNGVLLASQASALKRAGLHRVNVSIDSLDPHRFRTLTGGGDLNAVIAGLEAAFTAGLEPVKINAVVHPHTPFELPGFERLIRERPVVVRFIARMNLAQYQYDVKSNTWVDDLEETLLRHGFEPEAMKIGSGPAVYYRHPRYIGAFGIINHRYSHACERCNRLRLTADGRLKPCLFSGETISVLTPMRESRADSAIADCLRMAVAIKPKCGWNITETEGRTMREIGG